MPLENRREIVKAALVFAGIYAVCTVVFTVFNQEYATLIAPFVKLGFNLPQGDLIIERVEVEPTMLKLVSTVAHDGIFGALHGGRRLSGKVTLAALTVSPVLVLTVVLGYPKCTRGVRLVWLALSMGLVLFITMIATPVLTVGKLATYALKQPISLEAFLAQSGAIPAASLGGVFGLLFASEKLVAWWVKNGTDTAERNRGESPPLATATVTAAPGAGRAKASRDKAKRKRRR